MKCRIFDIGSSPPRGEVPERMYAAVIRPERYGVPKTSFEIEEMPVQQPGRRQVLVQMMACCVNYNGIWASLGRPIDVIARRRKAGSEEDFHIGGSEGSGIVWAVGDDVTSVRVGDPIVVTPCRWDEQAADVRAGADPVTSLTASVWGYEDNWGGFAQFSVVEEVQCFPKPPNFTWEEAACSVVSAVTSYRQLMGWPPNTVRPGDPVLIWGGAGGLGSAAIQLVRLFGGVPIAVVSSESRAEFCRSIGAHGVINRSEFDHWGRLPSFDDTEAFRVWLSGARRFGEKFWEVLGERKNPRIVFEHSGMDTLPTSLFVCDNAGMVVTCGGTSGFNGDIDLRMLWMRAKRLQGSHFATTRQCLDVIQLVADGRIDPCLSHVFPFHEVPDAHQLMYENRHPPGNMALLVNAPEMGMTDLPI